MRFVFYAQRIVVNFNKYYVTAATWVYINVLEKFVATDDVNNLCEILEKYFFSMKSYMNLSSSWDTAEVTLLKTE